MTYYTTRHIRPRAVFAPDPPKAKPAPEMTWAEMAKAEGHRKGVPRMPTPMSRIAEERKAHRIRRTIEEVTKHGQIGLSELAKVLRVERSTAGNWVIETMDTTGAVEKFYCKDARRHFYRLAEGAE